MPGVVEITGSEEAGFWVRLQPPDPAFPEQWFPTLRAARGAAGGIRLVTGRRKVDSTGGEDGKAA